MSISAYLCSFRARPDVIFGGQTARLVAVTRRDGRLGTVEVYQVLSKEAGLVVGS